jgi:hypothetical protein
MVGSISSPQNVVRRSLTQADYQNYLLDNLKRYRYRPRAPIHEMMTSPNNLFNTMNESTSSVLTKLMGNVYAYGRQHWTWEASSPRESTRAFDEGVQTTIEQLPLGTLGRGLLDGTTTGAACGGFASAMKGMAAQVFNIQTEKSNVDGSTAIFADFITLGGVDVIDSSWRGNVWLDAHTDVDLNTITNRPLGAFEFNNHYFCNYQGTIYDVTCNQTFVNTSSMIWCKLTKDNALLPNYPGAQSVFTTAVVTRGLIVPPRYLVWINREPSIGNGFSNWLLTDRASISVGDMKKMGAWSSR